MWRLGQHRLICGDACEKETRQRLIGGDVVDLVLTDPPYDMEYSGLGSFERSTSQVHKRLAPIIHWQPEKLGFLPQMRCNSFYVFTSKNGIKKYMDIFAELNYDILIWAKTNCIPFTNGTFLPQLEYMLYFSREGRIWNNSLTPTSCYAKYYLSKAAQGKEDGGGDLHPTMKPLQLFVDKIRISSNSGGIVLDLFGGSGTTLIACEQTGRRCYMAEIEPQYCDVILTRWEKFTGQTAVLED